MVKSWIGVFPKVVGIDVSESQILSAKNSTNIPTNVEFMVGPSEVLNYEEETVDLITVCQAVHWFDIPKFYKEVDRQGDLTTGGVSIRFVLILRLPYDYFYGA